MEGNDLGITLHSRVACMFEGLLMRVQEPPTTKKRSWFRRDKDEDLEDERALERLMRTWKPNELPLKSVIHMTTKMGIGVEVYTFMEPHMVEHIETWLSRKGAHVRVYSYYDIDELWDDFKYNREVHTFFTTNEEHARKIGMRATVVTPEATFGV